MFQLSSQSIVLFASLVIYVILASFILYSGKVRLKRLFTVFLIAGVGISATGLLMNLIAGVVTLLAVPLFFPLR